MNERARHDGSVCPGRPRGGGAVERSDKGDWSVWIGEQWCFIRDAENCGATMEMEKRQKQMTTPEAEATDGGRRSSEVIRRTKTNGGARRPAGVQGHRSGERMKGMEGCYYCHSAHCHHQHSVFAQWDLFARFTFTFIIPIDPDWASNLLFLAFGSKQPSAGEWKWPEKRRVEDNDRNATLTQKAVTSRSNGGRPTFWRERPKRGAREIPVLLLPRLEHAILSVESR